MSRAIITNTVWLIALLAVAIWAYNIGTIMTPYQPTKIYKDGSYIGCIKGKLCEELNKH